MVEEWRLAPAVGEKKREEDDGLAFGGAEARFEEEKGFGGTAERRSRDIVEEAPTPV